MSENRKFIRFFKWVTVIFFILTYVFSIQEFKHPFINNGFLETIFGGLFASFGVMLLAEIKKYSISKRSTEDLLYFTLLGLYSDLVVEAKNVDVYLKNPDSPVPNNLFSDRLPAISGYINALRGINYAPFKENDISKQWNAYRGKEFQCLDNHTIACRTHLFLAINQEKLRALDRQITYYNPTAKDHNVSVTLRKMKADAIERARAIEAMQDCISATCANRYQWKEEKANLQSLEIGLPTENPRLALFFED